MMNQSIHIHKLGTEAKIFRYFKSPLTPLYESGEFTENTGLFVLQYLSRTLLVIGLLSVCHNAFGDSSPTVSWQKNFGKNGNDGAYAIVQTADNGFALAGYQSKGTNDKDIWIIKLDSTGNLEWEQTFGKNGEDYARSIIQTIDGKLVVAGQMEKTSPDLWIVKLDQNGKQVWEKSFGKPGNDRANSIIQTVDGGFAVAGMISLPGRKTDAWLLKLNNKGDLIWETHFGENQQDGFTAIVQTRDNGLVMAGYTSSPNAVEQKKVWLVKVDHAGKLVWQKRFQKSQPDRATAIIQTQEDGFIVVAKTKSKTFQEHFDVWLLKLDSLGNLLEEEIVGGMGEEWANALTFFQNSVVIAGGKHSLWAGSQDAWIFQLGYEKQLLWEQTFGGYGEDEAYSIIPTADNGLVVAGETTLQKEEAKNVWVMKLKTSQSTVKKVVTEANQPPVCSNITANPTEGLAPLIVKFNAVCSDPEGDSLIYTWDFGDDNSAQGATLNHTYSTADAYRVHFRVSDPQGLSSNQMISITVQNPLAPSLGKAIIIAGGDASAQNTLFPYSNQLTQQMYRLLKWRGFTDADIFYLHPQAQLEMDTNHLEVPSVDYALSGSAGADTLEIVFQTVASQLVAGNQFIFYLHSHAEPNLLKITSKYELSATQFKRLLEKIPTGVEQIIILDTCYSGSFLQALQGVDNRLVITSADAKTPFWNVQYANFSETLIRELRQGNNLTEAFSATEQIRTGYPKLFGQQRPQLDANGDGIFQPQEIELASQFWLGDEYAHTMEAPTFIQLHPRLEVEPKSAPVILWAKTLQAEPEISQVQAILIPPNYQIPKYQGQATDWRRQEQSMLYNPILDRYELVYDNFSEIGIWQVMYQAQDLDGALSKPDFVDVWVDNKPAVASQYPNSVVELKLNRFRYHVGNRMRLDMTVNEAEHFTEYDLYAAVLFPSDYFITITYPLTFSLPDTIQPYQLNLALAGNHTFSLIDLEIPAILAKGFYGSCGLAMPAGAEVLDEQNWQHIDCKGFEIE